MKERDCEFLTLMVAVNDEHGNPTGKVDRIEISERNNEVIIDLEGPIPGTAFCDIKEESPAGVRRWVKISRRKFRVYGYQGWAGNWCWDAYLIGPKTAAKLVNYIRILRDWHCQEAESSLFNKYEKNSAFERADFFRPRIATTNDE